MERFLQELLVVPDVKLAELNNLAHALTEYTAKENAHEMRVDGLADKLCTSERNLRRRCNKWFHMNPSELLTLCKINAAKVLLENGDPVGDVAYQVGFTTHSHFSNVFKRHVGVSPSEYRRQARGFN